jgi:hypothetical protein
MKLSELKSKLDTVEELHFQLPDGSLVPSHFHVTEIGSVHKKFIDCGGTIREESFINFQLWSSIDINHRLQAKKLKDIISLSQEALQLEDLEIEVEHQGENTVGKYNLDFDGDMFLLTPTHTDCLAKSDCLIPAAKQKLKLSELTSSCCQGNAC